MIFKRRNPSNSARHPTYSPLVNYFTTITPIPAKIIKDHITNCQLICSPNHSRPAIPSKTVIPPVTIIGT